MYLPLTTFLAAKSISAVSSTIQGLIPPSSSKHFVRFAAAACATCTPIELPPVNAIKSNFNDVRCLDTR